MINCFEGKAYKMPDKFNSKYSFITGNRHIDREMRSTIESICNIRKIGDEKYTPFSWENTPETSDATIMNNFKAICRHFTLMNAITELDESGYLHIEHLLTRSMFLITSTYRKLMKKENNNRLPTGDIKELDVSKNITPELMISIMKYNSLPCDGFKHLKLVSDTSTVMWGDNNKFSNKEDLLKLKQYYIDAITTILTDIDLVEALKFVAGDTTNIWFKEHTQSLSSLSVDLLNVINPTDEIFYLCHELCIVERALKYTPLFRLDGWKIPTTPINFTMDVKNMPPIVDKGYMDNIFPKESVSDRWEFRSSKEYGAKIPTYTNDYIGVLKHKRDPGILVYVYEQVMHNTNPNIPLKVFDVTFQLNETISETIRQKTKDSYFTTYYGAVENLEHFHGELVEN